MLTPNELRDLEKNYTDRVDCTLDISLHEYGLVRNPKTTDTLFCLNPVDNYEMEENFEYKYDNLSISKKDVIEALIEIEKGYFSFIGSDLATELETIDNNELAHTISSLNSYNGKFYPHHLDF